MFPQTIQQLIRFDKLYMHVNDDVLSYLIPHAISGQDMHYECNAIQ